MIGQAQAQLHICDHITLTENPVYPKPGVQTLLCLRWLMVTVPDSFLWAYHRAAADEDGLSAPLDGDCGTLCNVAQVHLYGGKRQHIGGGLFPPKHCPVSSAAQPKGWGKCRPRSLGREENAGLTCRRKIGAKQGSLHKVTTSLSVLKRKGLYFETHRIIKG